MSFLKSTF